MSQTRPSHTLRFGIVATVLLAGCGGGASPSAPAATVAPTPLPTPTPTVVLQGAVQDAVGDAKSERGSLMNPDLTSASIEVLSDGRVRFRARFVPGTYSRETTHVTFEMDTDENPKTGAARFTITDLGAEYLATAGSNYYGSVGYLRKYDGSQFFENVASGGVTHESDGIEFTLPGAGINGRMAFRVGASSQISSQGFTSVLDLAPEDYVARPAVVR